VLAFFGLGAIWGGGLGREAAPCAGDGICGQGGPGMVDPRGECIVGGGVDDWDAGDCRFRCGFGADLEFDDFGTFGIGGADGGVGGEWFDGLEGGKAAAAPGMSRLGDATRGGVVGWSIGACGLD